MSLRNRTAPLALAWVALVSGLGAIGFHGKLTSEKLLKDFIVECGFSVA